MYVDIIILANLAVRPQHGYEIKKSVEQVLGRDFSLNNGLLYPALRRFEEMGAITREVERQHGKPDRHIYTLTPLGGEVMHDLLCEFPPELAREENEFTTRMAFFDLLEPRERLEILRTRATALRESLAGNERIRATVRAQDVQIPPYAVRAMAFREDQTRHELEWIEALMHEESAAEGEN